nr:TIGR03084 family metal-binding protein [Amylibacter sp.]
MQQADDFRAECAALAAILMPLSEEEFFAPTQFKGWTIDDVLGHLHMLNHAAVLSLKDGDAIDGFFAQMFGRMAEGATMVEAQYPWLDGLKGRALFLEWQAQCETLADEFASADPKARVRWAGPSMSARSSITARQMETWAHGHEVFDLLGIERAETDRIKNIVVLGVNTFGWTYTVRDKPVPLAMPYLELTAPSGAVWTFGEDTSGNRISGSAVGFAQTVTQTRNWADTDLQAVGDVAHEWMDTAQCFAGGVARPPAKGTRFKRG